MRGLGVLLVAICALPAHGNHVALTQQVVHALTPSESNPTKADLMRLFADPVPQLRDIALDASADFGVRLRAIRSLALFCPATLSCNGTPAHAAVLDVLASLDRGDPSGTSILALRAAIETLGATRSNNDADVDRISDMLDHTSRDIRVAVARALRDLCNPRAIVRLRQRYAIETIEQVRLAISESLRNLDECS